MAFEIQIDSSLPNQRQTIQLDNVEYILSFVWNYRELKWYMSISDFANNEILTGMKLTGDGLPMQLWRGRSDLPAGTFTVIDTTGDKRDPERYNLGVGQDIKLIYVPEDEVTI